MTLRPLNNIAISADADRSRKRRCGDQPSFTGAPRRFLVQARPGKFILMHPRLEELSEHLDRQRAALRAAVNAVPVEQHATQPAEDAWSVLGGLEHLAIVEGRVGTMLEKQLETARANGTPLETDASPIVSTLNLARFTDRSRKIKGSDAVQPKAGQTLDELWLALDGTLANVRRVLASADGLKLTDITIPHPIFGPLDLYTWFAFIGSHEGRHAAQIREIGATLGRPT